MRGKSIIALRGAISVKANTAAAIGQSVRRLLTALLKRNRLTCRDVVSAIFSVTAGLDAAPPARAARSLGWSRVPMLCLIEMPVRGDKQLYLRVLLHVLASDKMSVRHIYLGAARRLRPDLA